MINRGDTEPCAFRQWRHGCAQVSLGALCAAGPETYTLLIGRC
jgi:hypothetical protein